MVSGFNCCTLKRDMEPQAVQGTHSISLFLLLKVYFKFLRQNPLLNEN